MDDGSVFSKQVHLCEAEGMLDFLDEDSSIEGNNESPLLVAVKTLREDANKNARYKQMETFFYHFFQLVVIHTFVSQAFVFVPPQE